MPLQHVLSLPSTVPPNIPSTIISGTYMALLIYLQQYWYRNYILHIFHSCVSWISLGILAVQVKQHQTRI